VKIADITDPDSAAALPTAAGESFGRLDPACFTLKAPEMSRAL